MGALVGSAGLALPAWQRAWSPACWGQGWTVFEVGSDLGWASVTVPHPEPGRPLLPPTSCALARRGAPPLPGQGCGYGPRCCPAPGALDPSEPASWAGAGQPAWCTPPSPSCVCSPPGALSPGSLSYLGEGRVPGGLSHWAGGGEERRLWARLYGQCTLGGAAVGSHAESQWKGQDSPYWSQEDPGKKGKAQGPGVVGRRKRERPCAQYIQERGRGEAHA